MQTCPRLGGMDRGMRRNTARERIERKERRKEKAKVKERKGRRKGERKARARATAGKDTWWKKQREQRWTEPFLGYCGHCCKWGHKKAQCHQRRARRPMELGAMVSNPSHSVVSDPESSLVPLVCWSIPAVDVDMDWSEEWCYDWEGDWMDRLEDWSWHIPEEYTSE